MIDLLLLLLGPALRYVEDVDTPWWRFDLAIVALTAAVIDIIIAHTTWRAIAGPIQEDEWTISHSLERLCHPDNSLHPDYFLFVGVGLKINRVSPTGDHIKVLNRFTINHVIRSPDR